MTVININNISGIASVNAQSNSLELFDNTGASLLDLNANTATFSGDITFGANSKAKLFENGTQSGVQATSSTSSAHLMTHDGNEDIHVDPSGYIKVEVAGSERLRITGIGSVGIGTQNPANELEVGGVISATDLFVTSGGDTTSNNISGKFSHGGINSKSLVIGADPNNVGGNTRLQFDVDGSEKMRIRSDGSVGIGTSNPGVRLHVRNDSGELARFQINDQTASGRIVCVGGTASYSGINFGDADNVDAGRIRHYNDDNSNASGSFLLYTNDTVRIVLNRYGLLTNYPGSNSAETGGTILGRYKYTQQNQSQNYEHIILGPDGRKLQDIVDTNCFCIITVCVTGTGTNNMFCQYHYHANQASNSSTLTHIAGNSQSSSNRPYMLLVNTHDPAWKMNHSGGYVQDIEVAIYGGNDQYTYTRQFGYFESNP